MSGCRCLFAASEPSEGLETQHIQAVLKRYRSVIACEATRRSVSIYDLPAPRSETAVIVGNEVTGIPRSVMSQADVVACVPMTSGRLSSVNVAVAASIVLYALTRDLGRKQRRRSELRQTDVDLLIHAPPDPYETGSLLRSVYAFGWRRAFVSDPHGVWFTKDPQIVLAGRAAARRANNLLTILPADQLVPTNYDALLECDGGFQGMAVSRLQIPKCRRLLLVIGPSDRGADLSRPVIPVTVDVVGKSAQARPRHTGSILLSAISEMLSV